MRERLTLGGRGKKVQGRLDPKKARGRTLFSSEGGWGPGPTEQCRRTRGGPVNGNVHHHERQRLSRKKAEKSWDLWEWGALGTSCLRGGRENVTPRVDPARRGETRNLEPRRGIRSSRASKHGSPLISLEVTVRTRDRRTHGNRTVLPYYRGVGNSTEYAKGKESIYQQKSWTAFVQSTI